MSFKHQVSVDDLRCQLLLFLNFCVSDSKEALFDAYLLTLNLGNC
jgi:hypothetical protein